MAFWTVRMPEMSESAMPPKENWRACIDCDMPTKAAATPALSKLI